MITGDLRDSGPGKEKGVYKRSYSEYTVSLESASHDYCCHHHANFANSKLGIDTCIRTYIHTYIHTYIQAGRQADRQT